MVPVSIHYKGCPRFQSTLHYTLNSLERDVGILSSSVPGHRAVMSIRRVFPTNRLLWVVAILCGALSTGSPARAGCGNHVLSIAHHLDADLLVAVDRVGPVQGYAPVPDAPRRPCTGPSCSRRPAVPMATPTSHSPLSDQCLGSSQALRHRLTPRRSVFAHVGSAHPLPTHDHLERPPRP